jgi:hypothetical protein
MSECIVVVMSADSGMRLSHAKNRVSVAGVLEDFSAVVVSWCRVAAPWLDTISSTTPA